MTTVQKSEIGIKAAIIDQAATDIAALISNCEAISRKTLNSAMTRAFGATSESGLWSQRDSFEMLEHATVKWLLLSKDDGPIADRVSRFANLLDKFPTQTVRSENQVDLQQFSTPLPLAAIAWNAAAIQPKDICLEPSAGTGLLAIDAMWIGAKTRLNEIDPLRAELLRINFPEAEITQHDAATIHARAGDKPTVIIMNPPFARQQGHYDRNTAARHLQSALQTLAPNGRCIAIMPDNFKITGENAELFAKILNGCTLQATLRLEQGFSKHGTTVATRLLVIDKFPGLASCTTFNRQSAVEFSDIVENFPARKPIIEQQKSTTIIRAKPAVGLFSAFKSKPTTKPVIKTATPATRIADVRYEVLENPALTDEQVGLYLPYKPSRVIFPEAGEHPSKLVESMAMGSTPTPKPTYVPHLPHETVAKRILSAAQLETIVFAGDAHERYLPGKYLPSSKSLALEPSETGKAYRQGFFLGDGTGAGKGRQIAGIILDQWLRGRRKHIWISESASLLDDARRDWKALGGIPIDIQPLSNWKPSEAITLGEGILFATYATMRSGNEDANRLQQILAWATDNYDGVMVFDEAHAMGGVAGGETGFGVTKGSLQGVTGVTLQNRLPEARVVYSSATGATDINNLAYAVRLGLWGPHTAFASREQFINDIRKGGIAAMEVVARELKGSGLYLSRMLSYEGVEYDILEHKLDERQIAEFDIYAEAWAQVHQNLDRVLELANIVSPSGETLNGQALGAARSRFESSKQRFFGQLLLTCKLPSLFPAIENCLENEKSAVVQLVSTAEAMLDRRVAGLTANERASLDIDLSPRELILDYLQHAFPTRMMETYYDDNGKEHSRPMLGSDGNPVYCAAAEDIRNDMIEMIGAMPPIANALDAIITRFGAEMVAEVTGRTRRLITLSDGKHHLESRSARSNIVETERFMAGDKRILIFSDAGGTGRSYHASLDCANQQQRHHFLLEPGWRADRAIQGLGRTNRTHQAQPPVFRPVTTDCRGERRFISTIARRLDSLGALTRGQRQTGGQNLFDPADNLESEYAKAALVQWFHLLAEGKLKSCSYADFQHRTGLKLSKEGGLTDDLPPIQRWLNRILALPIQLQNDIFDEFLGLVEQRVQAAREAGTLDIGVETIKAEAIEIIDEKLLRVDSHSGAKTCLLTIDLKWKKQTTSLEKIMARAANDTKARYLQNSKTKEVALLTRARSLLFNDGQMIRNYRLTKIAEYGSITEGALAESAWEDIHEANFQKLWSSQAADEAERLHSERVYIASGQLLPIWNKLSDDHMEVRRLTTNAGQSILGRIVEPSDIAALYQNFGVNAEVNLSAEQMVEGALAGRTVTINGVETLQLKHSMVNFERRLELVGADPRRLKHYKALGCYTELIQSRTRLFLARSSAVSVIEAITDQK